MTDYNTRPVEDAAGEARADWLDTFRPPWAGTGRCPGDCGNLVPYVATAYGLRAVCTDEGRRWSRIRGEAPEWTEETYSAMSDNVKEQGYGQG